MTVDGYEVDAQDFDIADSVRTLGRCLERSLDAMNEAIRLTSTQGPVVGMEYIADFLNGTDGCDPELADSLPEDWLGRWTIQDQGARGVPTNTGGQDAE